MRLLFLSLITMLITSATPWQTDFQKAKQLAQDSHKVILLNFSGSDWCAPCINLKKDFFENAAFKKYAEENLVLVNADFPRLKKNRLSKEQVKQNEALADLYNSEGAFPLTLLLDADGKILRKWDGLPDGDANKFIDEIRAAFARH